MSTPTDPAGADETREPVPASPEASDTPEVPASPEAPTAAYPDLPAAPADAETTAYPTAPAVPPVPPVPPAPADGQPVTPAYAPAPQAPYGQPGYGQPAYAAAAPPAGPDTRPKTMAWVSLGLAVLGAILACVGFAPVPWVGLISVIIGGLLLLVAFVLSIVALASRKQGGKPFGVVALVLSVLGGGVWAIALFASIALTAFLTTTSGESAPAPTPSVSAAPSEDGTDGGEEVAGEYDEAAFLAEARPAMLEVFQEVEPSVTEDLVNQMFPDEALIAAGQSMLLLGDAGRDQMIESLTTGGTFDDDTAGRFVDAIYDAATKHLQE